MSKFSAYWSVFDLSAKEVELSELEAAAQSPDLWNDPAQAQRLMKKLSARRNEVETWQRLRQTAQDTLELASMGDDSLRPELEVELAELERDLEQREFTLMLSGPHDSGDALLAIHAGAGGVDAQDWAQMLQRMYLRWIELRGFKADVLDLSDGEEAGIKSTTIAVEGSYAFGLLRAEKGVHRLVRLSPFDAAHRRHTSFALVEVLPQIEDSGEIEISPDEIRIDVYRSSGAGGQNVQKNATAVRITHLPSGLVVTCQNERSQTQNRENALRVLRSRLYEIQLQQQETELAELRGEYTKAEWGSQIRSYVLHPYQLVKDHRTDFEAGNAQGVLNGNLDSFIEAYLRARMAGKLSSLSERADEL